MNFDFHSLCRIRCNVTVFDTPIEKVPKVLKIFLFCELFTGNVFEKVLNVFLRYVTGF